MKFSKKIQANAMDVARVAFASSHPAAQRLISEPFFGVVGKIDNAPVVQIRFFAEVGGKVWTDEVYIKILENSFQFLEVQR